jgi:Tol biopolymer transport system component
VPPPKTTFHVYGANVSGVKVSPDGRRIAFGTREADGNTRLWIRDLESLEPFPVPGGESPLFPFWSPDSRSIGFFARGKLKVVEASPSAAPPREIADVAEPRGGSWGEDGTILYTGANFAPLMRVPASGGKPVQASKLDRAVGEAAHRWPFFLPGAKTFLFEVRRFTPAGTPIAGLHGIYAGSLSGEKRLLLSEDTGAEYVAPGYLLFRRANNLMAVRFDASSLTLRGEPVVLAHDIEGFVGTGASIFSVSGDLLVYSPRVGATPSKIAWFDRSGRELATVGAAGQFVYLAMAADGGSVVTSRIEDPLPPDLWLFDTGVGRGIRLTRDAVAQVAPIFSADPNRILFSAFSTGPWDLWEMSPRPGQVSKPFLQSEATKIANDVSPDGRWLLFRQFNPGTRGDLMVVSLEGDRTPRPYLASLDDETNGVFSRDGRWVAYASDESGRKEIYVASFPDPTRRSRVSADGGAQPRWSRDGKELYYVRAGQLLSVAVSRKENEIAFGESRPLFPLPLLAMNDPGFDQFTRYDVSPDGRFLALVRAGEEAPTPLVMVSHWRGLLPDSGRP